MEENHGPLVSFNGSKVVDCETNEVLFNETMTVEQGQAVLEHMKKFDVKPMIDKEEYMYVNDVFDNQIHYNDTILNIIQYEARGGKFKLCEKDDLAAFADYLLNKILTAGDPEYLKANYKEMMEPFKDTLSCMFTAPFYFEFTDEGIDKAKALDTVLTPMGYKKKK
jgi:hydroxymethylpyrimidine pyrophosphatase-like HAD family hydrolase